MTSSAGAEPDLWKIFGNRQNYSNRSIPNRESKLKFQTMAQLPLSISSRSVALLNAALKHCSTPNAKILTPPTSLRAGSVTKNVTRVGQPFVLHTAILVPCGRKVPLSRTAGARIRDDTSLRLSEKIVRSTPIVERCSTGRVRAPVPTRLLVVRTYSSLWRRCQASSYLPYFEEGRWGVRRSSSWPWVAWMGMMNQTPTVMT